MFESILIEKMLAHLSRCSTLNTLLVAEELITKWLDEGSAVDLIFLSYLLSF